MALAGSPNARAYEIRVALDELRERDAQRAITYVASVEHDRQVARDLRTELDALLGYKPSTFEGEPWEF
jgi:hypothetical protein